MQILLWFFRIVLFLLMAAFAIKNDGLVRVQAFFDSSWNVPLVGVMLASFAVGLILGVVFLLPDILSSRRELALLKQSIQEKSVADENHFVQSAKRFGDLPDSF